MARIYGPIKGSWLKYPVKINPLNSSCNDVRLRKRTQSMISARILRLQRSVISDSRYLVPPGGYGRIKKPHTLLILVLTSIETRAPKKTRPFTGNRHFDREGLLGAVLPPAVPCQGHLLLY
jgi:hypothetical protein